MAAQKECLYVVLDVSESMRPHLAQAVEALNMMLNAKILFQPRDVVGIGLHGTAETRNAMNAEVEDGQYEHIVHHHNVAPVSFATIEALDSAPACAPGGPADLIDSLALAMDAVLTHVKKLKFGKRVLLVTDGTSPASVDDEQFEDIVAQLADSQIDFEVIGIGFAAASSDSPHAPQPTAAAETLDVLRRFEVRLGSQFRLTSLRDAADLAAATRKKATRATSAFSGPLRIGPAGLPVVCWKKAVTPHHVKWTSISKSALSEAAARGATGEDGSELDPRKMVQTSTTCVKLCDPKKADGAAAREVPREVPPEDRIPAYRFGKELVPVPVFDADKIKLDAEERSLTLLGFMRATDIPRHILVGRPECVVSDTSRAGDAAYRALQALMTVMEEEGLVGVARYVHQRSAPPALVCLTPTIHCLCLVKLPYAEEFRQFDWGPRSAQEQQHTPEQRAAADALVDALELEPSALRPKHVHNPQAQRAYQCITHRARANSGGGSAAEGSSSTLPPPHWRITFPFKADPKVFAAAAPALANFAGAFPLVESVTGAGGKRPLGGGAAAAEKRSRCDGAAASDAALPGAAPADGHPQPTQAPQLLTQRVVRIDPDDPVATFWAMLKDDSADRTDEALCQMRGLCVALLQSASASDQQDAEASYACMREMRRGALWCEEPEPFNSMLRRLRDDYAPRAALDDSCGQTPIWRRIGADPSLRLITRAEVEESDVSEAEAAAFAASALTASAPLEPDDGGETQC